MPGLDYMKKALTIKTLLSLHTAPTFSHTHIPPEAASRNFSPTPYNLHPTPDTLHPTSYTQTPLPETLSPQPTHLPQGAS
jgi:hypothetical protein